MPINSQLSRYDLHWCRQRIPVELLKRMKEAGDQLFIAGGYIRSCISREPVQDIDLFCPSKELARSHAQALACRAGARLVETENAFTVLGYSVPLQFIHRWTFDKPESLISSFDFTIAAAAIWWRKIDDKGEWQSLCHDDFYSDLAAKRLVYTSPVRVEDAGGSMLRVLKFYQRGYRSPLDSLGRVMARLCKSVDRSKTGDDEHQIAKVLTSLLRCVPMAVCKSEDAIEFVENLADDLANLAIRCEQYEAAV